MSTLIHIKQLVIRHKVAFTEKARIEMARDGVTREMVYEALLNAPAIVKSIRSRNPQSGRAEKLHVIISPTYGGIYLYTKGRISVEDGAETLYILISSKRNFENI